MNQRKIGEFLKQLRKEKGVTQEQLAEQFYVSSRTVSRWETGNNMPDLQMLIDLADFYKVNICEIIDGERQSENMKNETKELLQKAAEYAEAEQKKQSKKRAKRLLIGLIILFTCIMLFGEESKGLLYGIVSEKVCVGIVWAATVLHGILLIESILYIFGINKKSLREKRKDS